jgi:hypothetical protein
MAIFFEENFAVSGHQYRNRVSQQKHPGRDRSRHAIRSAKLNACIFQIHGFHEMVQGYVGVPARHARQQRGRQPGKRDQWISAECAKEQIEPYDIGF